MGSLHSVGKFVHIQCTNHILDFFVKEYLNIIETLHLETIKYIKRAEERKIKFVVCIKNLSLKLIWRYIQIYGRDGIPYNWCLIVPFPIVMYFMILRYLMLTLDIVVQKRTMVELKGFLCFTTFYEVPCLFTGNYYPAANI